MVSTLSAVTHEDLQARCLYLGVNTEEGWRKRTNKELEEEIRKRVPIRWPDHEAIGRR